VTHEVFLTERWQKKHRVGPSSSFWDLPWYFLGAGGRPTRRVMKAPASVGLSHAFGRGIGAREHLEHPIYQFQSQS
jgi:hypothetical protein